MEIAYAALNACMADSNSAAASEGTMAVFEPSVER